jgi:hypothetical protein
MGDMNANELMLTSVSGAVLLDVAALELSAVVAVEHAASEAARRAALARASAFAGNRVRLVVTYLVRSGIHRGLEPGQDSVPR